MVSEKVTIVNPSGLHLLNAVNLSNSVSRYKSSMSFTYENNGMQGTVNLKSILSIVAFPMAEENNGNGTVAPAFALPGATPWRTITVGDHLKPIVETTVPWDVVSPLYETKHDYRFGRGTWSWIHYRT